jgi:transcriptional regulator with XRE-family HTH domain
MVLSFEQQWIATMNHDGNQYFKAFGRRIAERRKEVGLTQVELAEALGVAQQTYACYETGTRRIPLSLLPVLAHTLTTDIESLLGVPAKARSKRGPAPKLQQHIERINQLPKPQQRFVLQMLETALAQQSR